MSYQNKRNDKKHKKMPEEKQERNDRQNNHQMGKNKAQHEYLAEDLGEYSEICNNVNKNFLVKHSWESIPCFPTYQKAISSHMISPLWTPSEILSFSLKKTGLTPESWSIKAGNLPFNQNKQTYTKQLIYKHSNELTNSTIRPQRKTVIRIQSVNNLHSFY